MKFLEPVFPAILPAVGKPEEEGDSKKKTLLGPEDSMIERLLEPRATPGPGTAPLSHGPISSVIQYPNMWLVSLQAEVLSDIYVL